MAVRFLKWRVEEFHFFRVWNELIKSFILKSELRGQIIKLGKLTMAKVILRKKIFCGDKYPQMALCVVMSITMLKRQIEIE